jgi:hypothetical protein
MNGAAMVHSPGYQVPLWLGPAQLRLWRKLDRLIGGRTFAASTVRGLSRELRSNPGTISRDLDALARLGLAVHDSTWGRAGVRLWRVVAPGGRRGLDPRRQRRALARMGITAAPGQLTLAHVAATLAADDPPAPPSVAVGSAVSAWAAEPIIPTADRPGTADRPTGAADAPPASAAPGPFRVETCPCGRSRIVMDGRPLTPCPHPAERKSVFG